MRRACVAHFRVLTPCRNLNWSYDPLSMLLLTSEKGWGGDTRLTAGRHRKRGCNLNTETHFILVYHHFRELQILLPTCTCQTKQHYMSIQTFIAEIS